MSGRLECSWRTVMFSSKLARVGQELSLLLVIIHWRRLSPVTLEW